MEINLIKSDNNTKEILEMILQYLYENKFIDSQKLLAEKANIIFDQKEIQQLKNYLKDHLFEDAIVFLDKSNFENVQKSEVLKLIKARKYIELVKQGKKEQALQFLRNDLSQMYSDQKMLNKFAVLLFQNNESDIEKQLKANFNDINNDEIIIKKIQSLLCLSVDSYGNRILPNSRLETLLKTYLDLYNNVNDSDVIKSNGYSNIMLHNNNDYLKFDNQLIIEKHDDEVWLIEFSANNKYFVTCSRNGVLNVFQTDFQAHEIKIECINSYLAHRKYLTSMKWCNSNPECNYLLTSSADKQIKLWNAIEGKCLKTFLIHLDIVTSVLWLNNDTFISGSIDKKMLISTISNLNNPSSMNSKIICSETFLRIRELLLSPYLNCVIVIPASMNDIIFYNYKEFREVHRFSEPDPVISAAISKTDEGRYLITNVSRVNASINLYDLSNFAIINKFYGHNQDQYIIKCSFAGTNDEYIICGSEDANIFLWHRNNSAPLQIIKGHTGAINSSEWIINSVNSILFSVSDDHTLRVWTNKKVEIKYTDLTLKENGDKRKQQLIQEGEGNNVNHNFNYVGLLDYEMSESNSEGENVHHAQSHSESEET